MNARRTKRARAGPVGDLLDARAVEAIERFARVMAHCGFAPKSLARAFQRAIAATHVKTDPRRRQVLRELLEAAQLVTLWCASPDYVDERGVPRPLPARGPGRSIEALARSVDTSLDLGEVLRYLLRTQTIRKAGKSYVLNRRWVYLRGVPGYTHARSLRVLVGILRTMDHNLDAETNAGGWFEFTAENQRFPVSQLPVLEQKVRREGLGYLRKLDLFMQRCAAECDPAEPTVWIGVGTHQYQHDRPGTTPRIRLSRPAAKWTVKRRRRRGS